MKKYILPRCLGQPVFFPSHKQQQTKPKGVVADKILAVVGDKIVMQSDIDNSIIDMIRQVWKCPKMHVVSCSTSNGNQGAGITGRKDSLPITDEDVETIIDNRIRSFIQQFGSKDELRKSPARPSTN